VTGPSLAELAQRARAVASRPGRQLLGITGPPGAGKSRLADRLAEAVTGSMVIGMDGFHIGHAELERIGRAERKGAPDTFDRAGFVALLRRLRAETATVYIPVFDRSIEDSIAAARAVPPEAQLLIIEGNYLLHWPEVRPLLAEVWYLDPPREQRLAGLAARHHAFGKPAQLARDWARGPDERNAELVAADREAAELVLGWGDW